MRSKALLHSTYIVGMLSKELLIAMAALSIVQTVFLSMMLPNIAVEATPYYTGGFVTPQIRLILAPVLGITGFLYAIVTLIAAAQLGLELERGDATIYLSHPISRSSYVLSWIIASLIIPSTMFFISLAIPLLVVEPRLLFGVSGEEMLLLVLQVLTGGFIVLAASLLFKKRSLALASGFFEYLILPLIMTIALAIFFSLVHNVTPSARDVLWLAILYPYNYLVMFNHLGARWIEAAAANIPVLLALIVFVILYAKRRLEVG